jgi:hypothetical protein
MNKWNIPCSGYLNKTLNATLLYWANFLLVCGVIIKWHFRYLLLVYLGVLKFTFIFFGNLKDLCTFVM